MMRSVVAKKPIDWSEFVGDDIRVSFDMTYIIMFLQEFEDAKMMKESRSRLVNGIKKTLFFLSDIMYSP